MVKYVISKLFPKHDFFFFSRLLDVIESGSHLYLVFEYLNQDLKKLLENTQIGLPTRTMKSYTWQLLQGLAFCHVNRIIHRDMKPQNLLVDKNGYIKIGDFGLARAFEIPMRVYTHEVVTLWYRSPEILLGTKQYGPSVDIWSLGCIFAEMSNKKPLFSGDSEIDQLLRIFRTMGTPSEKIWPNVVLLSEFKSNFPVWKKQNLSHLLVNMERNGVDLLEVSKLLRFIGIGLMFVLFPITANVNHGSHAAMYHARSYATQIFPRCYLVFTAWLLGLTHIIDY